MNCTLVKYMKVITIMIVSSFFSCHDNPRTVLPGKKAPSSKWNSTSIDIDYFGNSYHSIAKLVSTEGEGIDLAMSRESMINKLELNSKFREDCHRYGENSIVGKSQLFSEWRPKALNIEELKMKLVEVASNTSILVINEAHYDDRHRVLLRSILPLLKKEGYKHLLLEGVNPNEEEIESINNGIVKYSSGAYVRSTEFGNLIRYSKANGFSIFGYEASGKNLRSIELRENEQYQKVDNYLKSISTDEKVIIYCGYGHLYKTKGVENSFLSLIERLINKGKYSLTTIDQTLLSEYNCASFCLENYKKSQTKGTYSLFSQVELERGISNGSKSYDFADYYLVHPQVSIDTITRRPSYLSYFGRKMLGIDISDLDVSYPVLIAVYEEGVDVKSEVPSDLFFASSQEDRVTVFITKGDNKLIATDNNGIQYIRSVYTK